MLKLEENFIKIRENIEKAARKSGRKFEDITLVAVTKTVNSQIIKALTQLGIKHIGENKVQIAQIKRQELNLTTDIKWHMIGHLQRNKVKTALEIFDFFHSIDSIRLAKEISQKSSNPIPVLLEVNTSQESQKFGFKDYELKENFRDLISLPNLKIQGLMTMAPFTENMETCRQCFIKLRNLLQELNKEYQVKMKDLSMGMTQDYEVAVEEGASIVRIGSAFFKDCPI